MTIQEYVDHLKTRYKAGISREHSYRGDLQLLSGSLLPELLVTNEPTRSDVGSPDYILTKTDPGFIPNEDDETTGKVWINANQYFGNVPKIAWEFYIGGYQPAEKWLKDRRDRELSFEEIQHYQKIIVALVETNRIMEEVEGRKII